MYKIRYYYSSLSKQVFIITVLLTVIVRFVLFFLGGFYKDSYLIASVVVYLLAMALCVFFTFAWRFFYAEFDEKIIIWHNRLLKRETSMPLATVRQADFTKKGILLYDQPEALPRLTIPFYRLGVVSPVGVENFQKLLKALDVPIRQDYDVLPGFGPSAAWFSRGYFILTLLVLFNMLKYLLVVILILAS